MMHKTTQEDITIDNVWQKVDEDTRQQVISIWNNIGLKLSPDEANDRANQLVFVVRNQAKQVVGMSTGFKAYLRQFKNHFYAIRLFIMPAYRKPGLSSKILVLTRDFFEDISRFDQDNTCIGVVTLVENERLKQYRNEAIWPASKMVYMGNSDKGHHIRVYYFKGSRISP
ncbi:MAG TPA: hypothetical protein PKC24_16695 [Cyclobacteriaceae bacterium]|nr:hypothetical protein [Cyclobacteriaceae bacterium]